jgi:hypothetical protein
VTIDIAVGDSVRYVAIAQNGGEFDATVRGVNPRGGLDIDVHVPGCTAPVSLTNIVFSGKDGEVRGSCFKEKRLASKASGQLKLPSNRGPEANRSANQD